MHQTRLALLSTLVLVPLILSACSDYELQVVPRPLDDEPSIVFRGTPGTSPIPVTPPGPVESGPSSPWDSLDPGEFPEEYFAVAWNDPRTACINCFSPLYSAPRYDIVDAQGRVLVRFDLPWDDGFVYEAAAGSIEPAGPGRFLATTGVWTLDGDNSRPSKAWFGDGLTGEVEVVMEWGWGNIIYLPSADREIELTDWLGDARVMPDPTNEDRIYVLPQNTNMYANPLLGTLYSIDVRDPEAPVVAWSPEDMVRPELIPEWGWAPWYPWYTEAFFDGQRTVIVLGLEIVGEDGIPRRVLTSFSPQLGPLDWELDLTDLTQQTQVVVRPPTGEERGHVLFNGDVPSWCSATDFKRWDGEDLVEVEAGDDLSCVRLGPTLDPTGRTFLYYGHPEDEELELAETVVVSHAGVDVWELDSFRDGLNIVPIDIHDLERLLPPSSD